MNPLPDFLDLAKIGKIALLVTMLIQYVKDKVPGWAIKPYLQVAFGIGFSFWWETYTLVPGISLLSINWIAMATNGIFAAIAADTGYNFLSVQPGSPAFTLPRKQNGITVS